jgi:hypothetical protein
MAPPIYCRESSVTSSIELPHDAQTMLSKPKYPHVGQMKSSIRVTSSIPSSRRAGTAEPSASVPA